MVETVTEEQLNKFKEISKGEIEQKVIKFINDFINKKPSNEDLKIFADFITQSDEKYMDYVIFVDYFNRQSKSFKFMSKWHIWIKDNHTKYSQYFKRTVNQDKKLYKIIDKAKERPFNFISDIDPLILTKGE